MACPIGNDFASTLFSDAQLAELASLLNVDKSAMCPLCRAGAAISIWRSTSPALSVKGTKDALVKYSKDLTSAVEAVRALDWPARFRVLREYGHSGGGDYEALDFAGASKEAGQRNNAASRRYQADLKAAANLAQALTVAARRIRVNPGQPEKIDARVEAEKIIEACEKITGAEFANSRRGGPKGAARRFVLRALDMLGHAQAEADGAIRVWVKRNRKRIASK
jgi:hypothetical protein